MEYYGRLGKSDPGGSSIRTQTTDPTPTPKKPKLKILLIVTATFLLAFAVSAAIAVVIRNKSGGASLHNRRPSQAMSRACSRTRFPTLCVNSLLDFPGALTASDKDLVHISVNMTLQKIGRALYSASEITNLDMDPHVRSAYVDCLELLDDSVDLLSRSLTSVAPGGEPAGSTQDVLTWLSAALTNQDTCTDGFDELNGVVKSQISDRLKDLSELVSNCLAMYAAAAGDEDFSGIPIQNRRRRRLLSNETEHAQFPIWLSRRERVLLDLPVSAINADIIVSRDGNGTYKTITQAIKKAPEHSNRRFIIYVRAGRYEEKNLKLGRKKTNIMFIGDGKGKTVISGGKSVQDNLTTFHTASFVDFIFGNAAVVFQNCTIHARKPMQQQKNTITAQNRKDPNQNTGISIHACRIVGEPDLEKAKAAFPTYLGRPWKMYARTVYMLSYMGDHIHPKGWLEWNATFALDTLYYGEYMNYGPGAGLGQRVKWPGYRVITSTEEASKFTVAKFIFGSSWLPSTGVAYLAGLST
ncbi:hypothetical protein DH2020_048518 [Rehmannia glutinosa]|uniref:Pectinesterase inhibitor domain-containing protein n=1 Tax=Rehmannia glutinosa TaxID=99300 RepID=A0ABR0U5F9_REHGL